MQHVVLVVISIIQHANNHCQRLLFMGNDAAIDRTNGVHKNKQYES